MSVSRKDINGLKEWYNCSKGSQDHMTDMEKRIYDNGAGHILTYIEKFWEKEDVEEEFVGKVKNNV